MKTLILIRHAKSSRDDASLADIDRPLNDRGHRDAPFMAESMLRQFPRLSYFISSPAVRTKDTAVYFAKAFGIKKTDLKLEPRIYEAPLENLMEVVAEADNSSNHLVMFGHNPGMSMLVHYYTDELISMPTCGIAVIRFDVNEWKACGKNNGTLQLFDYPKRHLS